MSAWYNVPASEREKKHFPKPESAFFRHEMQFITPVEKVLFFSSCKEGLSFCSPQWKKKSFLGYTESFVRPATNLLLRV